MQLGSSAGARIRSHRRGRARLRADAHGRRAPGAARAVDRSAEGGAAARRDDGDGRLREQARRAPAARDRRSARHPRVAGGRRPRARAAAAAGAGVVSRVGGRNARRDPPRRGFVSPARPGERRRGVVHARNLRGAREDRPVGRGRRRRQPRSSRGSATGCASSGRACAARSSRICAARTPRSICRIRSSPSATAATCS